MMTRKALICVITLGVVFQIGHFIEHATQAGMWVFVDRSTAYMSPLAMMLVHLIGGLLLKGQNMARQMLVGMEMLHLVGNLIFLGTLAGMYHISPKREIGWALKVETFHLYEHIMLTSTAIFLGKAVGLSTLFGGADALGDHNFAVGYRVLWHFAMNLVPSALMAWSMAKGTFAVRRGQLAFTT